MVPGTERAAGLRVQGLLATEQGYGLAGRAQQCSSTAFVRQVWRRQAAAAFTHTLHPAPFVLPPAALSLVQPPAKIDVALLRGTSADLDGNVSFEREALFCDQLNQAMAAHNSGGLVVVQARQQRSGARKARGRRGAWARQRHRHSSDLLHRGWLPKGCLPGLARADPCAALLPSAGGEQCGAGPPHLSPTVDAAVSCHALKRTTDVLVVVLFTLHPSDRRWSALWSAARCRRARCTCPGRWWTESSSHRQSCTGRAFGSPATTAA